MVHPVAPWQTRSLTPEEDVVGDPEGEDDEIDDTLPADLWFRSRRRRRIQAAVGLVPRRILWRWDVE